MSADPIRREQVLARAVAAGKFPPHRVDHYRAAYDSDPLGTEELIEALAAGLPPADDGSTMRGLAPSPPRAWERHAPARQPDAVTEDPSLRGTGRIFHARDQ